MICEAGFLQACHARPAGVRRIVPTLSASIVPAMALKTRVKSRPVTPTVPATTGDTGPDRDRPTLE
jgi:hypothetical protein